MRHWIEQLPRTTLVNHALPVTDIWLDQGYLNGLDTRLTWRVTKIIRLALAAVDPLDVAAAAFCRCIVLRTAQWALDMRSTIPTVEQFRSALVVHGYAMLSVAAAYAESLPNPSYLPDVMDQGVPGLANLLNTNGINDPALILTSPPYPGVYVPVITGWKLLGRREIRAPYWITNRPRRPRASALHHACASRTHAEHLLGAAPGRISEDIARLATPATTVVQLVGFNNPPVQLSRYLRTMSQAGFQEVLFSQLGTAEDGRLWRSVPSRRWWTEAQSRRSVAPHTAQEVVLIHRLNPV